MSTPRHRDVIHQDFVPAMQARLEANVKRDTPLFTTDADGLFDAFIAALPEHEQQHHTCNACKHFIRRYGGLVTIDDDGTVRPAFWNINDTPELYRPSVFAMLKIIGKSRVNGVYYTNDRVWGQPVTGIWTHLAVRPPAHIIYSDRAMTANQKRAEKLEDHGVLCRALDDFKIDHLRSAVNLLQSDALRRSDRFLPPVQWLLNLKQIQDNRHNLIWRAVATAPAGWCKPRSGVIGALLQDIGDGLSFDSVKARFAAATNSEVYQRAQTAPSDGAIRQAEKMFAELGLAPALDRRYARLDELPYGSVLWSPLPAAGTLLTDSLFGHLRKPAAPTNQIVPPAKPITWEKFQRDVLPNARNIEVRIPSNADRFMALVTAANESAPPILQWDSEDNRNSFSWYYASGIDAEMRRRLVSAGAQVDNNDIRASLMWHNFNDLDIHCVTPAGNQISFRNRRDYTGGWLDVDANAGGGQTDRPVENIRWGKGQARNGTYRFYVCLYATHRSGPIHTPFTVELEINGRVFSISGTTTRIVGADINRGIKVAEFVYRDGNVSMDHGSEVQTAAASANAWNVAPNTYVPVTAIVPSPNLWNGGPKHNGQHAFFLLAGCRDEQDGVGRGFLTEMLKSDLHPVRSVLEAYNAQATIMGKEDATACGIGISKDGTGDLIVRVTTNMGKAEYKIDRWD